MPAGLDGIGSVAAKEPVRCWESLVRSRHLSGLCLRKGRCWGPSETNRFTCVLGKSLGTVINAQFNAFICENTTAVIGQDSFCKEKSPLAICRGFKDEGKTRRTRRQLLASSSSQHHLAKCF